jgi:hypothetical protein
MHDEEADQIAEAIIKRNDGDERADFITIALLILILGSELIKRYPNIIAASKLEVHAKHGNVCCQKR